MSYELFIAKRYLRSKRKTGFISLITYISIFGVMLGVAALIITLGVANGFEEEVRSRIIGFDAHIRLRTFHDRGINNVEKIMAQVDSLPHVIATAPSVSEKGLIISSSGGKTYKEGVFVKGIDPAREARVTNLIDNITWGTLNLDTVRVEKGRPYPGIVLGRWLGDRLNVVLGDRVTILSASGVEAGPSGTMHRFRTYRVAGFFETGLYEYDDNFAFVSIREGQRLAELPRDRVSWIQVKLDDMNNADIVRKLMEDRVDGFPYPLRAITWFEMNKNLFSWMKFEKWLIFIALSLIIIVAVFNIVSTLIMVVLEKRKEIGILKSMGSTSRSIMKIFVFEGLVAGVIGTVLGLILGYGTCLIQIKWKILSLPGDVYIIDALPVKLQTLDGVLVVVAAIVLSLLATIYPAWQASKLDPVDAIRYE
ncbi:MAG TPA: ABC transporter permease [Bacteroidetes bacterium]|nr:ABC transporter permease [Bacteroidota bacterium]